MKTDFSIKHVLLFALVLMRTAAWSGAAADGVLPGHGLERRTLVHDGLERVYWVHFPPDFEQGAPSPLVLGLHGGGGQGKLFDKSTLGTLSAATDRAGMVLVFPDGIHRSWNDGREEIFRGLPKAKPKYDDVGFLVGLIDTLIEEEGVDPQRVYATGISNGGFMSYRLALERSDKVAAVAPVAAQISLAMKDIAPNHPVSVMVVNGTDDPLVPYQGGDVRLTSWGRSRGKILSTEATIEQFREFNRCRESRVEILPDLDPSDGTRVIRESHTGGLEGAEVVLLRVEGGGHTWPLGQQYLRLKWVGVVSRDVNASEEIVGFFSRHTLDGDGTQ